MFMARVVLLLTITIHTVWLRNMDSLLAKRREACNDLNCDSSSNVRVCGVTNVTKTERFKIFPNECALLQYGCLVEDKDVYGLTSMEYCRQTGTNADTSQNQIEIHSFIERNVKNNSNDCEFDCNYLHEDVVCGIKQDGEGYRIKQFKNACELFKYNCDALVQFIRTDTFICEGAFKDLNSSSINIEQGADQTAGNAKSFGNPNNIVVIDGSMLGQSADVNETIENFFAATHVLDLPITEINNNDFNTRRMLLKNLGPIKVFRPWITIPKKIKTDYHHEPTLSTCYHKCPTQCPDTYSPVCGVPGILAREPSIMFQNHCYMDVAQCKMYWENKSATAVSSSYIESSFLFCLGDQLNGMYRFLPLVKTLQHMGRLRNKGKFRYRLHNMRFFNNYAYKEPKLMG